MDEKEKKKKKNLELVKLENGSQNLRNRYNLLKRKSWGQEQSMSGSRSVMSCCVCSLEHSAQTQKSVTANWASGKSLSLSRRKEGIPYHGHCISMFLGYTGQERCNTTNYKSFFQKALSQKGFLVVCSYILFHLNPSISSSPTSMFISCKPFCFIKLILKIKIQFGACLQYKH